MSASIIRSPEVLAIVNGKVVQGLVSTSVRSTNYMSADTFEFTTAASAGTPEQALLLSPGGRLDVELRFGLNTQTGMTSLLYGKADAVAYDASMGLIRVEGRDRSADLIDSPIAEAYANRTASEVATLLAERHGLFPNVAPTSTLVGRYYQSDHQLISLDAFCSTATEWDFLCLLAEREGFNVFVVGNQLNFVPSGAERRVGQVLSAVDFIQLSLQRSMRESVPIEVVVKSWNSREHSATTVTSSSSVSADSDPSRRRHVLIIPNLPEDVARTITERRLAEMVRSEKALEGLMPGELSIMPRSELMLVGTQTDFDGAYTVDLVERAFSPQSGFVQWIYARATTVTDTAV